MKRIVFCLPGAPTLEAVRSWDALRDAFAKREDLEMCGVRGYSSSVRHCRNQLLENGVTGLKKDAKPFGGEAYDYMMWIDSDSVYTPDDFFKLLEMNVDIATGLVPINFEGRGAVGRFNNWKNMQYFNLTQWSQDRPPVEVDFCGFAFVLIKYGVFESMDYPWFTSGHFVVDDYVIDPGEDVAWCIKAKAKGWKIYAHPGVRIQHDKRMLLEIPGPLAAGAQEGDQTQEA